MYFNAFIPFVSSTLFAVTKKWEFNAVFKGFLPFKKITGRPGEYKCKLFYRETAAPSLSPAPLLLRSWKILKRVLGLLESEEVKQYGSLYGDGDWNPLCLLLKAIHYQTKIPGLGVRCLFMSPGMTSSWYYPTRPFSPELGDKAPLLKVPHPLIRRQSD